MSKSPESTHVTGRRVVAQILDFFILGFLWFVADELGFVISDPVFLAVMFLYFGPLQGITGLTLGKMMTGIRVVDANGQSPGPVAGIKRALPLAIELFGFIALVFILQSPWRQRAGDRWAKTYVVRARALQVVRAPLSA